MNFLFFSGRIIYGGGEKVHAWLVKALFAAGHSITYMTPEGTSDIGDKLQLVGLRDMVSVVYYARQYKKKNILKYIKSLNDVFTKNKIDFFVIFGGSLIEQMVARKHGVKVVLSERCDPHSRSIPSQILKQIQYRNADGYVFQTPDAAKCYGKRASKLGAVIPNPIIDKLPDPQLDSLRKEIVSVGRLSDEKNQQLLIDAFESFHIVHPEYKLLIYGSGPLERKLQASIQAKCLTDKVEIIKGKRNIPELINGAALFVLSSNTEGMPNALIESMSMGLMSISTDCPIYGPRMLIEHGVNGYLVPINDIEALYEQMCYAIEHEDQARDIRNNALLIRDRLSSQVIAEKWIQYFERIIKS